MIRNAPNRERWIASTLESLPAGDSLLDVGAGECRHRKSCAHLEYVAQDIAEYDGQGNARGLQTGQWDVSQLDLVCDLYDIPEDRTYDAVLCSEVLEHVSDPVAAMEKLARLVRPGGALILTAPFVSATHFAPYHYATGFSEYFYRHHLDRLGFTMERLEPNGGYFDFLDQELSRIPFVRRTYGGNWADPLLFAATLVTRLCLRLSSAGDGEPDHRHSSDLLTFGWHVVARRAPPS